VLLWWFYRSEKKKKKKISAGLVIFMFFNILFFFFGNHFLEFLIKIIFIKKSHLSNMDGSNRKIGFETKPNLEDSIETVKT
jgi:hypothetical protein